MSQATDKKKRAKPRKSPTERFNGWRIRPFVGGKFQIDNMDYKNRVRQVYPSLEAAKGGVIAKQAEIDAQGTGAFALTAAQKEECLAAYATLRGRATIGEVLAFWASHHPDGATATLAEMVQAWIADQTKNGLRPGTIKLNRQRLEGLARTMGNDAPCASITSEALRNYLDGLKVAPVTRNGTRRCLRAFFQFCEDREIVLVNPMLKIKPVALDAKMPDFMDERLCERFMHKLEELHPESVPAFAIAFWAGLRPVEVQGQYTMEFPEVTQAKKAVETANETLTNAQKRGTAKTIEEATQSLTEARKALQDALATQTRQRAGDGIVGGLQWEDVNLRDMVIRVRPETSKTRSARLVEIAPNLATWLVKYYKATGPVSPSPVTVKRHRDAVMEALKMKKWIPDIPRHSFATYHFAQHQNRDKLAAQMGHSGGSGVLEKHYKGLATTEQAARYWAILPAGAKVAKPATKSSKLAGA